MNTSPQRRQACCDANRLQPQDHGGAFPPNRLCEPIKKPIVQVTSIYVVSVWKMPRFLVLEYLLYSWHPRSEL